MIATGRGHSGRHKGRSGEADSTLLSAASRYEVIERAGEGTLFVVYRVRDRETGSYRALKALKGAYSRHERFSPAVLELTGKTGKLNHPHVAQPHEAGREEGTVFVVEDWLPGGSLDSRIRRGPMGPIEANQAATQIAEALEYLHGAGQVHGDLRPRQVLFDAESVLYVNDIGFDSAFVAADMALSDVQMDAVAYTSPERFDGGPATPASDLYALGVLLYRAITGRVPFDGPSPLSIAMRHRNDEPLRPSQWNRECPKELEKIILRLLEKDPKDRYASATELLNEIAPNREKAGKGKNSASKKVRPLVAPASSTNGAGTSGTTADNKTLSRQQSAARPSPKNTRAVALATVEEEDFLSEEEKQRRLRLNKRQHRRREMLGAGLAFFWLIVFGGLLYGMVYGAYIFWMKEAPPELRVPVYTGLSQDEAEATLAKYGLKLTVGKEVYNPKKPEGTILSGEPAAGKVVRRGRTILVTVSRGEQPIRMINYSEITLESARAIITKHGLRLGQVSEQYHSIASS
jgi:eukaryotic-like serine/threonine-protein kinase